MPRNGGPCDGSTSVSAGRRSKRRADARKRATGIAVGLARPHRDVRADARQQHVAGDQQPSSRSSRATRARASARSRRSPASATRPSVVTSPSIEPRERMRRLGHAAVIVIAARRQRREMLGRHAVQREQRAYVGLAEAGVLPRSARARRDTRPASSQSCNGNVRRATRRCRGDRDGSASRRSGGSAGARASSRNAAASARASSRRRSRNRRACSRRPRSISHRFTWSSANGSGIRSQSTPGATSRAWPGCGGASAISASSRLQRHDASAMVSCREAPLRGARRRIAASRVRVAHSGDSTCRIACPLRAATPPRRRAPRIPFRTSPASSR